MIEQIFVDSDVCSDLDNAKPPCAHYLVGGFCALTGHYRCQEWQKLNEPALSHSAIKDYTTCRHKYWLGWRCGWELIAPAVRLRMGKYASDCFDLIHSEKPYRQYLDDLIEENKEFDEYPAELAALDGLLKAYCANSKSEFRGQPQFEFRWNIPDYPKVHGYLDLVEYKDSSKPTIAWEFKYSTQDPSNWSRFILAPQLTTYFIGVPSLQRITARIIRVPQLRLGKEEKLDEFTERVYADVKSRPGHYFKDMNFWREEFDLQGWMETVRNLSREIGSLKYESQYYQTGNRDNCFKCDFRDICESGVVSETIYRKREIRK